MHREICVKDFSATTAPRNLKYDTNRGYHRLYFVRENQHSRVIIPSICTFFFHSNKIYCHTFLGPYESQSFKLCIHLQRVEKYCVQESHGAGIYFAFIFSFVYLAHQCIYCIRKFMSEISRELLFITAPRNLKFGTNIAYH